MWLTGSDEDDGSILSHPSRESKISRLESRVINKNFTYIESPLQLASGGGEAVEDEVLPHTVDPLSSWGQSAADEVSPCSLSRGERSHDLTLRGSE